MADTETATMERDAETARSTHVDVLIVGAGISGIGSAHHLLDQCPDKSVLILEAKDTFGGTWETHKYPGTRSDSDLYTFGSPYEGSRTPGSRSNVNSLKRSMSIHRWGD